MGGDFYKRTTM